MSKFSYLLDVATTEKQRQIINEMSSGKTTKVVSRELDVATPYIWKVIGLLKKRYNMTHAEQGEFVHTIQDPYIAKGVSTYYNKDGQPTAQWVKTQLSQEKYLELLQSSADLFYQGLPKIKTPAAKKQKYNQDIIPWFQIGDAHLGMLAHEAETGHNFDLKIAVTELMTAFQILFDDSEPCERCVINDLGDMSHYENYEGVTSHSGHALDYDGRFHKMIEAYIPLMRFIIEAALDKFKYVDVIINQGNHSRTNDIWMALLLQHVYENNERVHVLKNANVFIPYRMGKTLVMVHHTDKCKPAKLPGVMATDYSKDWGECDFRYIDTGHVHHGFVVKEHPGVLIESWNNLAATDKYAHEGGWRSKQSLTRVDRSKTFGNIGRRTLSIEEVHSRIETGLKTHVKKGYKPPVKNRVYTV